jgi:predicted PhzF superfamily epimerase YddE/YHI9
MRYLVSLLLAVAAASSAAAQSLPDSENGRYTLSPVKDGVVRLDTRSGTVSTCTDKGNGWACYTVPDERAAFDTEIGRLQKENEALKAQLAARGDAGSKSTDTRKIEIPLPSDRDIDRVMSTMERAWRRLVEMAGRWQQDPDGKI